MKKTYPLKTVYILSVIFGFMFSISYIYFATKISNILTSSTDLKYASEIGSYISVLSDAAGFVSWGMILLSGLLGIFVTGVIFMVYYSKKDKSQGIFIEGLISVVASLILACCTKGGSLELAKIMVYILIANSVFVLLIALRADNVFQMSMLDNFLPQGNHVSKVVKNESNEENESTSFHQAQQNLSQETTEAYQPVHNDPVPVQPKKPFLKTKKGVFTIVLIILIACAYGAYQFWDSHFNKIEMDVFGETQVVFSGFNGDGTAEVLRGHIDYDSNDILVSDFAESITFEVNHSSGLSNGDTVTVKAIYSQEDADRNKVVLKEKSKQYKVEGLTINYKNASEIDDQIIKDAYKAVKNYVSNNISVYNSDTTYEYTGKAYYICDTDEEYESEKNSKIGFIYKTHYTDYDDEVIEKYQVVTTEIINSSFDYKDAYCNYFTLNNSDNEFVKSESEFKEALEREYSKYTIEEITKDVD